MSAQRFVELRRYVLAQGEHYLRLNLLLVLVIALVILSSGCPSKTVTTAAPPAPPPPPVPTASIDVVPKTVQSGQPVTITWKTANATDVAIAPLGAVDPSGSQTLTPTESTTYHITAKGPGGTQELDARVTVTAAVAAMQPIDETVLSDPTSTRLDVFFESDESYIQPNQLITIRNDADFLKQHPEIHILVEGHCDELGSAEYNLALGERRAEEVKAALEKAGVNAARIETISYGKERPYCEEDTEACWRMNRRAHIVPQVDR